MSRLLLLGSFLAILVNPLPGGGKVPAIGFAEGMSLPVELILPAVLLVSIVQTLILARCADWVVRKVSTRKRLPARPDGLRRYGTVAVAPLAPAGGGIFWAITLGRSWGVPLRHLVPIVAVSNALAFGYLYAFSASVGLVIFIAAIAVVAACYYYPKAYRWAKPRFNAAPP